MEFPEPRVVAPEAEFERTLCAVARSILSEHGVRFVAIPKFGLDIAFFIWSASGLTPKFIEFKCFAGGRAGGVGFGNGQGKGPQVELLKNSLPDLELLSSTIGWVLVDALLPPGEKRYAFFDCVSAKNGAMGEVKEGKQNNLRISSLRPSMTDWPTLVDKLKEFLLD